MGALKGAGGFVSVLLRELGTTRGESNPAVSAEELCQFVGSGDGRLRGYGFLAIAARFGHVDTVRALGKAGVRSDPPGGRNAYVCAERHPLVQAFLHRVGFAAPTPPANPMQGTICPEIAVP